MSSKDIFLSWNGVQQKTSVRKAKNFEILILKILILILILILKDKLRLKILSRLTYNGFPKIPLSLEQLFLSNNYPFSMYIEK